MPVDATQKKDNVIRLIESWDLKVLFQKVLPAGHNASQVIINIGVNIHKVSKTDVFAKNDLNTGIGAHACRLSASVNKKKL